MGKDKVILIMKKLRYSLFPTLMGHNLLKGTSQYIRQNTGDVEG